MIKPIHKILIVFYLIIISCTKETKQKSNNDSELKTNKSSISLTNNPDSGFKLSKIKSVCDCYSYSMDIFNEAISIRNSYENFNTFSKNQESVKTVKQLTKNWRKIRGHCLKTYEREMFTPNNCKHPSDSVEKIKEKFYSLGFSPSY